jgi:hypothetical protein
MYHQANAQSDFVLLQMKWEAYAPAAAELAAIAAALGSDSTTHDLTIARPPAAVKPGHVQTYFTNDALLIVNRAKGGNLSPAQIAAAINAALPLAPPDNTAAPVASGTGVVGNVLSVTTGTWTNSPTAYTYQWLRGAANIPGANGSGYMLQAADSGTSVSCRVTAINAAGEASATSNAIAVA